MSNLCWHVHHHRSSGSIMLLLLRRGERGLLWCGNRRPGGPIIHSRGLTVMSGHVYGDHSPRRGFGTVSTSSSSSLSSSSSYCSPPQSPLSVYVAATRQHVGKTSVSLALLSGLQKRFERVGFMKPVGQVALSVVDDDADVQDGLVDTNVSSNHHHNNNDDPPIVRQIDKDAVVIKHHFGLRHVPWSCISPVLIPQGYTRDFLDDKIPLGTQRETIQQAYQTIANRSDVILLEGTGHTAVGSVVDASNADVASWLQTPMVLVVNGGIGRSLDELALNVSFCQARGVPIAGVVVNQVQADKFQQTMEYMQKAFLRKQWDFPILGFVPDRPFLGYPSLTDLERLLDGRIISGRQEHALRHYRVKRDVHLVACSLEVFLQMLRQKRGATQGSQQRTLFVCHASRQDIILGFLMEAVQHHFHNNRQPQDPSASHSSMVVTGCAEHPLSNQVMEIVSALPHAPPVVLSPHPTDVALEKMYSFTPKLNAADTSRVATAVDHYEPHINFDLLLHRMAQVRMGSTTAMSSTTTATTIITTGEISSRRSALAAVAATGTSTATMVDDADDRVGVSSLPFLQSITAVTAAASTSAVASLSSSTLAMPPQPSPDTKVDSSTPTTSITECCLSL